ncbi:hypothetical protein [Rhodococcus qingshengii]|uniref:hypothetical protein n=1 Tax=Rhodococcus qingshengii TaxID=334542 RepID=UPI001F13F2F9|nr:hypothetical protein [Rhodococcus qingshengii]ULD38846.1 hypothetical protein JKI97_00660 [Rhodococcus qingshengii]
MKLYHRTTEAAADAIVAAQSWVSRENTQEVYFSSAQSGGAADGYGDAVLSVDVPDTVAHLDDEFPDGEQHFRVSISDLAGCVVTRER